MMTLPGTALAGHEFFRGMPARHVDRLAMAAHYADQPAGHRFFEEGGRADRFWLIQAGRVTLDLRIPGRGLVIIESLGRGTVLGWSWLFPPYEWRFGAVAAEPVRAIVLDGRTVRALCVTDPALGFELTRRFTAILLDRLHNTRLRLLDRCAHP
ncbi:cyclic nucleotide-binding domain-containing protein [Actinoallomurus purpureus]|uniref:cyclic nucleotide-binding domain-containing protein n=1 Tax=Actinoallomurus purpureus TaxID=478114 RepID=UPI002092BC06|nr:cyclic nucleotide-binding domain-containing protein [Actinoallomurus purpureus]MCO6004124.1 cyclic nucleotide-binding domain-containing protein [Actinoallomurus purpureus]